MRILTTAIQGVKIIIPDFYGDSRGYFVETYNSDRYRSSGVICEFVQDNVSFSQTGVVRGLHWQTRPYAQAKLVQVIRGAVWDVAVDIREGSSTFGQYVAVTLYAQDSEYAKMGHPQNKGLGISLLPAGSQFFIPRGFAHGFVVLEDNTLFSYKCDNVYHPDSERGVRFDDPAIGIEWPKTSNRLILSEKDQHWPLLSGIMPEIC